jgi:hypothetical protein
MEKQFGVVRITLGDVNEEMTAKVIALAKSEMFPTGASASLFPSPCYKSFSELGFDRQEVVKLAAKLYYDGPGNLNKILTIKFVRNLVWVNLKEAKDMVEWAVGGELAPVPTWAYHDK